MARAVTVEGVRFERYEAFRKWAEGQPGYWILVRGVPMPSPSPSRKHQRSRCVCSCISWKRFSGPGWGRYMPRPWM